MNVWIILLSSLLAVLIFGFWGLCAYYKVKYVVGTKNKFKRQIEEILEHHVSKESWLKIDYTQMLVEELAELISGGKILKGD